MICPKCEGRIVNIYVREGAGGKKWLRIDEGYCKKCKKIIVKKQKVILVDWEDNEKYR